MALKKSVKKPRLFTTFLKDRKIASIVSTSKKAVQKICGDIPFTKDLMIIEYGPGNGPFTKYLLRHMSPNSKLIVVETNAQFVEYLSMITDERLYVTHDSAEHILDIMHAGKFGPADYVLSGIPFSFLHADTRNKIIKNTSLILKPNGHFIVYQVRPGIKIALSQSFPIIKTRHVRLNIPSLYIFDCSF